ncbi:MAG: alpha-amylase [Bacteroidales bacterium]|nr:alpha-amylase [Bacteroidales bacterium]
MKKILSFFAIAATIFALTGCGGGQAKQTADAPVTNVKHADWVKNAVIYEVNVRQYSPESSFKAVTANLPRLKELGVDILWVMPPYPIGVECRKGTWGSYYAITDYKAINPEFGTMEDFMDFVNAAHGMGFKVILDWVANHTAPDHPWTKEHPDWYYRDSTGALVVRYDWTDIAQLNYESPGVADAMAGEMMFWVKECGIDGFRCDVAYEVPTWFWDMATEKLRKENCNIFMLAEAEAADLLVNSFDAYYAWQNLHIMNDIAAGTKTLDDYRNFVNQHRTEFPDASISMNLITNHDENSWNGTEFERYGEGVKAFAALTFALPGMPLIYTGQEVGMNHRLEFFEKDPVNWNDPNNFTEFYKGLVAQYKAHPALYNLADESPVVFIDTECKDQILAFSRTAGDDSVKCLFNLSAKEATITWDGAPLTIEPWGYRFFFAK